MKKLLRLIFVDQVFTVGFYIGHIHQYPKVPPLLNKSRDIVSKGLVPPLPVGENLDPPLNFLPPGSSKTKFSPQEAIIISVPTNGRVGWTAIL